MPLQGLSKKEKRQLKIQNQKEAALKKKNEDLVEEEKE